MDYYRKELSVNNISSSTPGAGSPLSTGYQEPTCQSDLYPDYVNAPTREIVNAIEGMALTRSGTDFTQLLQAILAAQTPFQADYDADINTGDGTDTSFVNLNLGTPPDGATSVQIQSQIFISPDSGQYHIEIKDSNNVDFSLAYADARQSGAGNNGASGSETMDFDIQGGTTMQVRIVQDVAATSPAANVSWRINKISWR